MFQSTKIMHDGYLFTLGVCGTASDASAAPQLLDAMLGALPPVKRAAFLGDVRLIDTPDARDTSALPPDDMLDPVAGDVRDAEVLLVVTPVLFGELPPRLLALLQRITTLVSSDGLSGKFVALVCLHEDAADADAVAAPLLAQFQRWCDGVGLVVDGVLVVPDVLPDAQRLEQVTALARDVYERASTALQARGITHAR